MRQRNLAAWLVAHAAMVLVAQPAMAQATITALARDLEPLEEVTEVRLTRFATFQDEPAVTVGMLLEPGDLVASGSGEIDLEMTCPGGTLLRFTGAFRVLVDAPSAGKDCAVNFLSGTLDVLTDQETEVNAGGILLGTEGTQYSVALTRNQDQADQRTSVWEGQVRWRPLAESEERWLAGGKRLDLVGGRGTESEVEESDLSRVADRTARFDVARSRMKGRQIEDPKAEAKRLAKLHRGVLEHPDDPERRVELVKAQMEAEVSEQARYHLERVGIRSPEEMERYQIDAERLPPSASDPFGLIEEKRYREALKILQQRLKSGTADSRDYYGAAKCYFQMEGRGSYNVSSYASRAIALHARDGKLSAEELNFCRHLRQRR